MWKRRQQQSTGDEVEQLKQELEKSKKDMEVVSTELAKTCEPDCRSHK